MKFDLLLLWILVTAALTLIIVGESYDKGAMVLGGYLCFAFAALATLGCAADRNASDD